MTRSALVASCTLALFITVPLVGCGKSKAPNAAAAASGEARSVRVAAHAATSAAASAARAADRAAASLLP